MGSDAGIARQIGDMMDSKFEKHGISRAGIILDDLRKTHCVGITGGVGSGKSEVVDYLKSITRCGVFHADDEAKNLYVQGSPVYGRIVEIIGSDVVDENGELDKALFAKRLYGESGMLDKVNTIVHPAVERMILDRMAEERMEGKHDFFFIEAALLIECGYEEMLDEIWYVYASENTRRERLKASRGYDDAKIDAITQSQLSDSEFRAHCSKVIDNDGSLEDMKLSVDRILEGYDGDVRFSRDGVLRGYDGS